MPQRDLQKEREAIGSFGKKYGRMPDLEKPSEAAEVYNEAYPGGLPEDLKQTVDASQQAAGLNTGQVGAPDVDLPQVESEYTDTSGINKTVDALSKVQQRKQKWSQPNQFVDTLQQALREKTGMKEKPIGKSRIFEQADVGGMGALQQSLSTRQQEMKINQTEFNNLVGEVAGMYQDQMRSLESQYESLNNIYEQQMDRLMQVERQARSFEQQKELLKMENAARKERIRLENSYDQTTTPSGGSLAAGDFFTDNNYNEAATNYKELTGEETKPTELRKMPYNFVNQLVNGQYSKDELGRATMRAKKKVYENNLTVNGYLPPETYNDLKNAMLKDTKANAYEVDQNLKGFIDPDKKQNYNVDERINISETETGGWGEF